MVAALARLQGAATDLRPLMQEIGEQLAESTKRRFDTATAPDGSVNRPGASTIDARRGEWTSLSLAIWVSHLRSASLAPLVSRLDPQVEISNRHSVMTCPLRAQERKASSSSTG